MYEPVRLEGARLPARLRDLPDPPDHLYVVGEISRAASVALVGTRTPSEEMARYARWLARELAAEGITILSGGAHGIDTQAHLGALDANGTTMVIAPSSFDRPFPEENAELFAGIVESGGAFVSAYERNVAAMPPFFFVRNGYLAALCDAMVLVESRRRGGGRNALKWARRLGRPVFAVPTVPWSKTGQGCLEELKHGARVVSSPGDVLRALRNQNSHPLLMKAGASPPGPQVKLPWGATGARAPGAQDPVGVQVLGAACTPEQLLALLEDGPRHLDELSRLAGVPTGRLQELVLTLTLEGILVSHPSGYVSVANSRK